MCICYFSEGVPTWLPAFKFTVETGMRRARWRWFDSVPRGLRVAGGGENSGKVFAVDYQIAVQAEIFIPLRFDHIHAYPFGQLGSEKVTRFFGERRFLRTPALDLPRVDPLQTDWDILTKYGWQRRVAQRDGARIGVGAIMNRDIGEW